MVVTIDGPAGAGKSSVARKLAEKIGFEYLDTGAMYRCVTLACLRSDLDFVDLSSIARMARSLRIEITDDRIRLDGEDVSEAIRTSDVTRSIKRVADNPMVRDQMVALQRQWTSDKRVVTEGRDQGTVAFPQAACKIFLTASPEERARRRVAQLRSIGLPADYDDILDQQNQRDCDDLQRSVGGLRKADDAIEVITDGLSEDQVLEQLIEIVYRAAAQIK